jgi:hypothetical protein
MGKRLDEYAKRMERGLFRSLMKDTQRSFWSNETKKRRLLIIDDIVRNIQK